VNGDLVLEALRRSAAALRALEMPSALIGGLAIQAWGRIRQTKDVDVLILAESATPEALVDAACRAGLRPDVRRPVLRVSDAEIHRFVWQDPHYGIDIRVDWMRAAGAFPRSVIARASPRTIEDVELAVASCEDLILLKLAADRPIDIVDAKELIALNADAIDFDYLRACAGELGLAAALANAAGAAGIDLG